MDNTVSAAVYVVHGKYVFREIIFNLFQNAESTADCFSACQKITDLYIYFLTALFRQKVDFPAARYSDGYIVIMAQQFHLHDILKNLIDVVHIVSVQRFTQPVVGQIDFPLCP
jgi:hypothetical protein